MQILHLEYIYNFNRKQSDIGTTKYFLYCTSVALYAIACCRCMWISLEYVSLDLLRYCSVWDGIC